MKNLPRLIFTFLLLVFLSATSVWAADFALTSIGNLDVTDSLANHMYYTGTQPVFSGTGTAGQTVSITVDSSGYTTTVASNEQWSWVPPQALSIGDHQMTFTSGSESISFALTIGSAGPTATTAPATDSATTASPSALPETGLGWPTLLILGFAVALIVSPIFKRFAFEK